MLRRAGFTALAMFLLVSAPALAQSDYPSRPIRLIVPFAAGGGNDLLARYVSSKLYARWNQPVVVENKPGAGGNLGADLVAKAPGDGYTLLLATNTLTINPYVQKNVPFDVATDFAPLALLAATPFVLVATAEQPIDGVKALIAQAKAAPGRISYASVGIGTPHHLGMELFKSLTGTDMVHVAYRGSVPALTATATGETQVMLATVNAAMPFLDNRKVRPLGVGERQRLASLPDVPTIMESGVPGFEVTAWYGVLAPAGTPEPVREKLAQALLDAAQDPEMKEKLSPAGFEVTPAAAAQFKTLIAADLRKWREVVSKAGIQPE